VCADNFGSDFLFSIADFEYMQVETVIAPKQATDHAAAPSPRASLACHALTLESGKVLYRFSVYLKAKLKYFVFEEMNCNRAILENVTFSQHTQTVG
jgi:hypothetical protein